MVALADNAAPTDLSVYIHWPFCASKCPYCDFNSHVADTIDHARWRRALLAELDHFANETKGRTVTSVFFGGGTPSLMAPETTAALIGAVKSHWAAPKDLEVTLEANPSTAEAGLFQAFRDAGVNRLSLGVQSLRDQDLKFLGRGHSADEAKGAIKLAARTFPRISFDLIYGFAGQTARQWRDDLGAALDLAGDHLSVYQLTIEPGTPFFRDGVAAADEDSGASLYEITQTVLEDAGLRAYEISNHARPGQQCRHNLDIWRGGDYAGIGPGAHGRLSGALGTDAVYQIHGPERWLARVEADGFATAKRLTLGAPERAEEILMTGLRLREGVRADRFHSLTGREMSTLLDESGLGRMIAGGFVEEFESGLRVTAAGRLCLNEVLRQLLANS
jgi:oxygen-independent coproporphyrinogen-3 oxidase